MITSRDNPAVKQVLAAGRRREPGAVLVEGPRALREAQAAGREIELLVLRENESFDLPAQKVIVVSASLFTALAQTETPQGVLGIVRAGYASLDEATARARAAGWPLVVLDGVQDPGNVGTILRTACAAGAPSIVLLPGTADALAPKAVRASAGNVFRMAVAKSAWSDLQGLRGYGADATASASIYDARLDAADMVVFGSEAHGLSSDAVTRVRIPMEDGVESLNVAAAAAVLLFELKRRLQR